MEVAVNYKLYDDESNIKNEGEARATLDEKYLTLTVMFGEPMLFAYTDIVGISDYDYKVDLFLTSKEKLNLWGLGYQYEDFLFQLYKLRNELMLKYLLMEESLLQAGFEAQYTQLDPNGQTNQTGNCEIRLYETALVVLPQKNEPIRLPYCYINNLNKQDYKLTITTEYLEKIEFTRLGQNFDPFAKALSDAINKMILRTQQNIKELIPEATPITINKLATPNERRTSSKKKRNRTTITRLLATPNQKNRRSRHNHRIRIPKFTLRKRPSLRRNKTWTHGRPNGYLHMDVIPAPQPRNKQTKQHNSPGSIQHPRKPEENKEQPTENTDSETGEETNQNSDRRTKTRHNRSNLFLQSNRKKRILTNQRRGSNTENWTSFIKKHQPIHD